MFGETFAAIFALIILPILIIGLSVFIYYISTPQKGNKPREGEGNNGTL
jgi:hypothetical protein